MCSIFCDVVRCLLSSVCERSSFEQWFPEHLDLNRMDQFEELNNILDDHFGTCPPIPTEVADSSTDDEKDLDVSNNIDKKAEQYLVAASTGVPDTNTESDTTCFNDPLLDESSLNDCNCSKSCLRKFQYEEIKENIYLMRELEKSEKDMFIMGVLKEIGVCKKKPGSERKRVRFAYEFRSHIICRQSFQIIYDTKETTLDNIQRHMQKFGTTPRVHGNSGRKPHNAFTFEEIRDAVRFISQYADQYGIPQPAAPNGNDTMSVIYLHCHETNYNIHGRYRHSCEDIGSRFLGLSSFKEAWLKCIPHIKISDPRKDVCQKCELSRRRIQDAVGDAQKLSATSDFHSHLLHVQKEKEQYQRCVRESMKELEDTCTTISVTPSPPKSKPFTKVHYTFDFSQPVYIPHHSRQMGPIYFKVPMKVQIFGVRLDGIPRQYNYLVDESQTIGENGGNIHGPDAVISMLNHALTAYSIGEKECILHADNCSGQNKNRYVIAYMAWLVMIGFRQQITYMMQIAGHARCLIDANFAHIKRKFKRSDVDSLLQLHDIVEKSAYSNTGVHFAEEEDWTWSNWKLFWGQMFRPFKGIRQYQVFRFHTESPGTVFARKTSDSEETSFNLLKIPIAEIDHSARPELILPAGLSDERQGYLYRYIRPFVRDPWKDVTYPAPDQSEVEE